MPPKSKGRGNDPSKKVNNSKYMLRLAKKGFDLPPVLF